MKANRSLGVLGIFVGLTVALSGCAVGIEETSEIESSDWAANDTLSIARDEAGTTGDVRSNDDPPDNDSPTKISGWTDGSKGSVEYNGDGTFTYTPDPNIDSGSDSFTYTAVDGQGNFSTATVNVTITAGWGRAVEMSSHYSGYRRLTDDSDNTTLVWTEYDGTRYNVWARHYTAATKTWGSAQKIDTSDDDQGQSISFNAIVDDSGNVTVVWTQSIDTTGTRNDMWAARYAIGSGTWSAAEKIENEDLGSPAVANLLADASGNVTAIWYQPDGARYNLWANRLTSGAWGAAAKIESEDGGDATISSNTIVIDDSGVVTAVWSQYDGTRNNLWANRASAAGTWQTATKIENEDLYAGFGIGQVTTVVDSAGTVNVIYAQYDGTRYNLWANRLTSATTLGGTTLTSALKIETEDLGEAYSHTTALDPTSRNLTVVWYQYDGTRYNLWANRYRVNLSSWGTATKIETEDLGSPNFPTLTIDSSANVTAVWSQSDGTRSNLWANRLASGQNFNGTPIAATKIESEDLGNVTGNQSLLDSASGNVTVIWLQSDGSRNNIWSNRYNTTTSSWGTAAKIETDDTGSPGSPATVIDVSGNITAAWNQTDGIRTNIWVNRMTSAGTWGTATKIDTEDLGSADSPALGVDSTGNVSLVWRQSDSISRYVWTSRYSSGAWTTADRLTTGLGTGSSSPSALFITEGDVPTLVGTTSNGTTTSLWVTDFR